MEKVCTDCKVKFNPSREGIAGHLNGMDMNVCGACCRKDG